jgi:meckelin
MVKHDMSPDQDGDDATDSVPHSLSCRIATGFLVYAGLALTQIAYKTLLYERLISDKMKEFVDLCSVSNVSVFIWVHRRFGYYIHGRSANGRADVNMKEMNELLKREEDDLCSKRGLLPNSDQQTFEMTLPIAMFDQYDRLRSFSESYQRSHLKNVSSITGQSDRMKIAPTYIMVSRFLAGFIEHSSREFEYTVKDKTILESVLDAEFDEARDKGYFYNGE